MTPAKSRLKKILIKLLVDLSNDGLHFYLIRTSFQKLQENAIRYNNRDDLLQLSFTLKISIFSEVYIKPSRTSMMELLLQK